MKKIASIAVLLATVFLAHAQKVTFYSPEFEDGVRYHIGLGESDNVLQTQTDTITCLNLSGLDITDIRDAAYLTAIVKLDLSYNRITDVSPLLPLASLRILNLSNNRIESVDALAFVASESLEVDVANNYISDFSYFYTPNPCDFTFIGMNMQKQKDAPYFDIYQLYADVNDKGQPMVVFRGYTNMTAPANIKCGTQSVAAQLDGHTYQVTFTESLAETTQVTLSNGEKEETTYAVPPADLSVDAGKTIMLTTGLPEDYLLTDAHAKVGTVEMIENTLQYTASADASPDVVCFSYYQGNTFKGRAFFYINSATEIKGDINGDKEVDVGDIMAIINIMAEGKYDKKADLNNDNQVDVGDIMAIINIMAGL